PFAFNDVHAVQIDAERAAAAFGDIAQLRRQRERLALLFFLGPARKYFLDAKQPAADAVDLPVAPVVRVIALSEHRFASAIHRGEFDVVSKAAEVVAAGPLI